MEDKMTSLVLGNKLEAQALITTFLESKGKATREAYRQDLRCFESYLLNVAKIPNLQSVVTLRSPELNFLVLRYRDHLLSIPLSPATINRRLGAIRSLYKLARMLGHSEAEIEIPNVRTESYRDTRGPGLPAFKQMIKAASKQPNQKSVRDRAILRLLFDLALRASELVGLDIDHVELKQKRLSIKGKGRAEREYLSLPATSVEALSEWIETRGTDAGPLFFNLVRDIRKRKRLSRVGLYELIRGLGEKVQVKTRPHGIRHLSITEACRVAQNNGYGIEEVMDHSRHKSVSTLMIYRDRERDVQGAISTLVANTILDEQSGE